MTTYTIYLIVLAVIFAIYYTGLILGSYKNGTLFVDEYSEEKAFGFKQVVVKGSGIDEIQKETGEIDNVDVDDPEIIENISQNVEEDEDFHRDIRARIENSLEYVNIENPTSLQTLDSQTMLLMMNHPIDKRKKIKRTTIFP